MSNYNTNDIIFIPSQDISKLNEFFISKQNVKSTISYKRLLLSKKGLFEIENGNVFNISPIINNNDEKNNIISLNGHTLFRQITYHKRVKIQYIPSDVIELRQEFRTLTFPDSNISLCIEISKNELCFEKTLVKCYLIVNKEHQNIDNKEISKYLTLFN